MTTLYVDGACKNNHLPGPLRSAGAGVYIDFESDAEPARLPALKTETENADPLIHGPGLYSRFAWRRLPSLAEQQNKGQGSGVAVSNNQAELIGVIMALEIVDVHGDKLPKPIRIINDSELVFNSVTKWMPGWRKRNYRKADGKPVANEMLVRSLDELLQRTKDDKVEWRHMNSHRSEPVDRSTAEWRAWHGNDVADRLANWACGKGAPSASKKPKKVRKSKIVGGSTVRRRYPPKGMRKAKPKSLRRHFAEVTL